MQNAKLPVDVWQARVRADATVAAGKSCHSDQIITVPFWEPLLFYLKSSLYLCGLLTREGFGI